MLLELNEGGEVRKETLPALTFDGQLRPRLPQITEKFEIVQLNLNASPILIRYTLWNGKTQLRSDILQRQCMRDPGRSFPGIISVRNASIRYRAPAHQISDGAKKYSGATTYVPSRQLTHGKGFGQVPVRCRHGSCRNGWCRAGLH